MLGGLSNLGATMSAPGVYEQRNAGHLLMGELAGGESERADRVRRWLGQILAGYGGLKASMLQDFERGRTTEVDFINGYVVDVGRQFGVPAPVNAAIVQTVHAITRKQIAPAPALLGSILKASRR